MVVVYSSEWLLEHRGFVINEWVPGKSKTVMH